MKSPVLNEMWKNVFLCSLLFFIILQIQHEAKTKTEMVWTYTHEGMSGGMLKMRVLSVPENQEEDQGEHRCTADKENELPW